MVLATHEPSKHVLIELTCSNLTPPEILAMEPENDDLQKKSPNFQHTPHFVAFSGEPAVIFCVPPSWLSSNPHGKKSIDQKKLYV